MISHNELTITDIVAYEESGKRSEMHFSASNRIIKSTNQRLLKHINMLFNLGKAYYGIYANDDPNHIVRLNTAEWSFYPVKEKKPFTEDEFENLITEINKVASSLPRNLHFLFSSFPVQMINFNFNVAIYVQCGASPIISCFNKRFHDQFDYTYPDFLNNSIYKQPSLSETFLGKRLLENHGIILCEFQSGVKFLTLVEICRDNSETALLTFHHDYLKKIIEQNNLSLPIMASQIVTAKEIQNIHTRYATTAVMIDFRPLAMGADKRLEAIKIDEKQLSTIHNQKGMKTCDVTFKFPDDFRRRQILSSDEDSASDEDLPNSNKKYSEVSVPTESDRIIINKVCFGSKLELLAYQYPLGHLLSWVIEQLFENQVASNAAQQIEAKKVDTSVRAVTQVFTSNTPNFFNKKSDNTQEIAQENTELHTLSTFG